MNESRYLSNPKECVSKVMRYILFYLHKRGAILLMLLYLHWRTYSTTQSNKRFILDLINDLDDSALMPPAHLFVLDFKSHSRGSFITSSWFNTSFICTKALVPVEGSGGGGVVRLRTAHAPLLLDAAARRRRCWRRRYRLGQLHPRTTLRSLKL